MNLLLLLLYFCILLRVFTAQLKIWLPSLSVPSLICVKVVNLHWLFAFFCLKYLSINSNSILYALCVYVFHQCFFVVILGAHLALIIIFSLLTRAKFSLILVVEVDIYFLSNSSSIWPWCWLYYAGRMETLALCPSSYLWCDPSGTKTSLGGLCRAYLGDNTIYVSI